MKIFVLNAGSSSLKYQLIDPLTKDILAVGICERIGIDGSFLSHKTRDKQVKIEQAFPTHKDAIDLVLKSLTSGDAKVINSVDEIDAIGHRVVHGGEYFDKSALVNDKVIEQIEELLPLAPLHNPANLMGIKVVQELMPGKPNVAVFDTAFHQTMPPKTFLYATPYEDYEDFKLRKYGFHGTSHYYVSNEAIKMLGNKKESKVIVCHLGNGSSICAVKNGKSIDTSMGLTPLEGLVMGTRSGDIDPAAIEYLMQKKNFDIGEAINYLNKKSGLLGVSGVSSDLREILEASDAGNKRAKDAIDLVSTRLKKYICAYAGVLGGVDAICFTAGIGENASIIREKTCEELEFLGVEFCKDKNDKRSSEAREISTSKSKTKVFVIPTNEEFVIAYDTYNLIK